MTNRFIYAGDGMTIEGGQRATFEKFLQRGGGVVVIHDGVISGDQHDWCKSVTGGAWRWPDANLTGVKATKWFEGDVGLYFVDREHPITRGVSNFDWKDEVYNQLDMSPDVTVLAQSFVDVFNIYDQESWREFFDTYWRLIHGLAMKCGLPDSEAQDVVQETMLSVAKQMPRFKYDPALGSLKG